MTDEDHSKLPPRQGGDKNDPLPYSRDRKGKPYAGMSHEFTEIAKDEIAAQRARTREQTERSNAAKSYGDKDSKAPSGAETFIDPPLPIADEAHFIVPQNDAGAEVRSQLQWIMWLIGMTCIIGAFASCAHADEIVINPGPMSVTPAAPCGQPVDASEVRNDQQAEAHTRAEAICRERYSTGDYAIRLKAGTFTPFARDRLVGVCIPPEIKRLQDATAQK